MYVTLSKVPPFSSDETMRRKVGLASEWVQQPFNHSLNQRFWKWWMECSLLFS